MTSHEITGADNCHKTLLRNSNKNSKPYHDMVQSSVDSRIFDKILENLAHDAPDLNLAASQRNKRTLARLAICCKTFLEPALDHLWRKLDSIFPLLKLLQGFKSSDGIYVCHLAVNAELRGAWLNNF